MPKMYDADDIVDLKNRKKRRKRRMRFLKILPVLTDYLQEERYAVQDHTERYYEGTC